MQKYQKVFSTKITPQNEPIPGTSQVPNSAGGYSWETDKWDQLDRFLILGTESGTYYISEHKLTKTNAKNVLKCIEEDGIKVVKRVIEISDSGRAAKNDPALFVLAMCSGLGDNSTRAYALQMLPKVARIGTHLFHFLEYVQAFRGWGRSLKNAVANWYLEKRDSDLAYQLIKYQQRDGWSHWDALRLSHPRPNNDLQDFMFAWVAGKLKDWGYIERNDDAKKMLYYFDRIREVKDEKEVIDCIKEGKLPWEAVPSEWLKSVNVWKTILPYLPMTATFRNLGRLTTNGTLKPMSAEVDTVIDRITDIERIKKARIHPIQVLSALKIYEYGSGFRGSLSWNPISQIVDALNDAFYMAFETIEPTNKRLVLGIDVSSSMMSGNVAGVPGITPRDGAGVMSLVTAATEKKYTIMAFCHQFVKLNISPKERLDSVLRKVQRANFGGTDCALPMIWAEKTGVEADAFIIYTDSETWAGSIHPTQALKRYRNKTGIPAKLVVVGMNGNNFTIADPNDKGMLDVVGFDSAAPRLIADFIRE